MSTYETIELSLESILMRIKTLEKTEKPADIARSMGVSGSLVSNWVKRGTIPYAQLFSYATKKGVYLEWLLTGETPEITDHIKSNSLTLKEGFSKVKINTDINASAGLGLVNVDNNHWEGLVVSDDWFLEVAGTMPKDHHRIISVNGWSMDSVYQHNDLILVDIAVHDFKGTGIYIFRIDEEVYIKKLVRRIDGSIEVISESEDHDNYILSATSKIKLDIVAQVICGWKHTK